MEKYPELDANAVLSQVNMCVMDDVGGMGGFIDFLQNIKHGDSEEKKQLRDWAAYMGWTGKLPKVESLL